MKVAQSRDTSPINTRTFTFAGVAITALQRFAIPIGDNSFPFVALLVPIFVLYWLRTSRIGISPRRLVILCAFGVLGGISALANPSGHSLTSLVLVLTLWTPAVVTAGAEGTKPYLSRSQVAAFVSGCFWTIVAAAIFGVFQFACSFLWGFMPDPLSLLPGDMLVGGFNTTYPVEFGGTWFHANGGIFLEASFLSLYTCLALLIIWTHLIVLSPRGRMVCTIILLGGLLGSVAVSGLVVLPLALLALIRSARGRLFTLAILVTAIATANNVPAIGRFVEKALQNPFDTTGQVSSAMRLFRPYLYVSDLLAQSPIYGLGPGSSRDFISSLDVMVTTPTLMKVTVEYGLVGLSVFLLLIFSLLSRSSLPNLAKAGLLVALIVPTDGLTSGMLVPLFCLSLGLSTRTDYLPATDESLAYSRRHPALH
jgi:hypothetical protein